MQKLFFLLFTITITLNSWSQIIEPEITEVWKPQPKIVTPGTISTAPSDATVLFDSCNLNSWVNAEGEPAQWTVTGNSFTVKPGKGDILTKEKFDNFQLHIEWKSPEVIDGEGQFRGNSGVFLQKYYEIQILDNYDNKTYANGQAGALYKQAMPLVNACKKPGEWETYDIIYKAPTFNENGIRTSYGTVTVLQNGVLIQNNTIILGSTEYIGFPKIIPHGKEPIKLQDHGNLVSYRNIWIRPLN